MTAISPNERAWALVEELLKRQTELRIEVHCTSAGTLVIDCGVHAPGGLEAGLILARACLADLGTVQVVPLQLGETSIPHISVATDHPLLACIGCQYAGWAVQAGKYFAMGSGPMRLLANKEEVLKKYGLTDTADCAVGILESSELPGDEVATYLADATGVTPERLALLVARTASIAGTLQVVARSVETCLHKMEELGLDLRLVTSGWGFAPLPPVARDDLGAIGRTNDAILYGSHVTLWSRFESETLETIGPDIPSSSSRDFGLLFRELFDRAGGNFYDIDRAIFSPAQVSLYNLPDGRRYTWGQVYPDVCWQSFSTQ